VPARSLLLTVECQVRFPVRICFIMQVAGQICFPRGFLFVLCCSVFYPGLILTTGFAIRTQPCPVCVHHPNAPVGSLCCQYACGAERRHCFSLLRSTGSPQTFFFSRHQEPAGRPAHLYASFPAAASAAFAAGLSLQFTRLLAQSNGFGVQPQLTLIRIPWRLPAV
jgi:hypothetical protein